MARSKKACIVFFDEVDAIGGARFDDGVGGDNEVQRTMLEIVNQLDGFDARGNIKVLMATNRLTWLLTIWHFFCMNFHNTSVSSSILLLFPPNLISPTHTASVLALNFLLLILYAWSCLFSSIFPVLSINVHERVCMKLQLNWLMWICTVELLCIPYLITSTNFCCIHNACFCWGLCCPLFQAWHTWSCTITSRTIRS